MPSERLSFDITGDATSGARAFRQTADSAVLAARGARLLSDELKHQRKSADAAALASLTLAKTDKILADAEDTLAGRAAIANHELDKTRREVDRLDGKTAHVRVDVDQGSLSRIGGLFGRGGGGLGGIFGSAAGSAGQTGATAGGQGFQLALSNPYVAGGAAAAAVTAAPFLGQIAGGGIITALGGGLAALGIAGALITQKVKPAAVSVQQLAAAQNRLAASQDRLNALQRSGKATSAQLAAAQAGVAAAQDSLNKLQAKNTAAKNFAAEYAQQLKVQAAFSTLKDHATDSLATIGRSFTPVLLAIAQTADDVLHTLTPVFAGAVKTISKPFSEFSDVLIRTFARPDVKKSIQDVANAFGAILTAVTPALGSTIGNVAVGVSKLAAAISANPQIFATFTQFLGQVAGAALTAIAWLTRVASYIEAHFYPALHRAAVIFDGVRHEIAHVWDQIFENSVGIMIRLGHNIETQFNSYRHGIAVVFDGIRHETVHAWDIIYNNTIGAVIHISKDVIRWFAALPGKVVGALKSFAGDLKTVGGNIIGGLLGGITGALSNVGRWVRDHIFNPIVGAIKSLFGIRSPSAVMAGIGSHLIGGLILGLLRANPVALIKDIFGSLPAALASLVERGLLNLASLPVKALNALGGLGGKLFGKAGVVTGWIEAALIQSGKPIGWLPALQALVSRESGGNPAAVNPVAVNGQHASGLWQMLPSTYAQFGGPAGGIFNPVVEGIAALKYIAATYGSPFNIPGLLSGNYVGYDAGGILPPGFHLVANLTGRNEQVIPARGGAGGSVTLVLENHGVIGSQAELDRWVRGAIDRLARTGQLRYALRNSPSAP